ncbi:hypothetical protein [Methylorubrum populi]
MARSLPTADTSTAGAAALPALRKRGRLRTLDAPTRRMLLRSEAAEYCGLGAGAPLPVSPKRVRPGKHGLRWDVRDLDHWLDNLESGQAAETEDDLLSRPSRDKGARSRS